MNSETASFPEWLLVRRLDLRSGTSRGQRINIKMYAGLGNRGRMRATSARPQAPVNFICSASPADACQRSR